MSTRSTSRAARFPRGGSQGRGVCGSRCIGTALSLVRRVDDRPLGVGRDLLRSGLRLGLQRAAVPASRSAASGARRVVALTYEGLTWFTGASVMAGALPAAADPPHPRALQRRCARDHDAERFQGGGGRPRDRAAVACPSMLGVDRAARLACVVMAAPQIVVVGAACWLGPSCCRWHRSRVCLIAQLVLMRAAARAIRSHLRPGTMRPARAFTSSACWHRRSGSVGWLDCERARSAGSASSGSGWCRARSARSSCSRRRCSTA